MTLRQRFSSWLHLMAVRVEDDFHTVTLTKGEETIEFSCYYQWTGSWSEDWEMNCSCPVE